MPPGLDTYNTECVSRWQAGNPLPRDAGGKVSDYGCQTL